MMCHPLSYSAAYTILNMPTTTCTQWHFQAAQLQRALHPNLSSQDLFHTLPITYGTFLPQDLMMPPVFLPRASQEASSPQPHKPDLNRDNASMTPLLPPKLMDSHVHGGSPGTIPQMASAVSTPLSRSEHDDFVPDESEFDDIAAMNDRPFLCPRLDPPCTDAFKSEEELKQHEAVAHAVQGVVPMSHEAARPSVSSTDKKAVARHDPITNQTVFDCTYEGCNKTYTTRNRVKVHSRTHSGLKPYKCPIPNCCYAATQKSSVTVHMLIHLPPKVKYERQLAKKGTIECSDCLKMYKTLATLGRHNCRASNE
ncbi:hypothetical protein CcCBS67573_g04142 [Chytriomyces confervae]|uniref:C2H2-type domain-containing protein n=1 Tax=Chytriomyces confervae TaxID=246404 RepID=A0A507FG92_9FUNG|nr:hypothetical protein HDU80_001758 [Chytriomyces hyalinus]TPX74587.1 hypothetical protein CcCBS67573_g04142 [Chytriomyces confervae]